MRRFKNNDELVKYAKENRLPFQHSGTYRNWDTGAPVVESPRDFFGVFVTFAAHGENAILERFHDTDGEAGNRVIGIVS